MGRTGLAISSPQLTRYEPDRGREDGPSSNGNEEVVPTMPGRLEDRGANALVRSDGCVGDEMSNQQPCEREEDEPTATCSFAYVHGMDAKVGDARPLASLRGKQEA